MGQGGWAERAWSVHPLPQRALVAALIVATGLVSFASLVLREPGALVASRWPAAGVAAIAMLAARGARPWAALGIIIANALPQLGSGREWDLIVGYAIANALEAWVMVAVLTWRRSDVRLDGLRDVGRLMVATVVAASTMAIVGGSVATLAAGADFRQTALSLLASHGTALIVIMPLALVPFRRIRGLGVIETVVQAATLVMVVVVIFWPGNAFPVMYVALLAILWGALRLPMFVVAIELVVMALLATALTARGGGPFSVYAVDDPRLAITLVQAFLSAYALSALFVAASRNDAATLYSRLQERESLLRIAIVNSETGILIAEIDRQRRRIVGANPTAMRALGLTSPTSAVRGGALALDRRGPLFDVAELDELLRARSSGQLELVRDDRRFDVAATVYPSIVGTEVATMVFTDVTARDERER